MQGIGLEGLHMLGTHNMTLLTQYVMTIDFPVYVRLVIFTRMSLQTVTSGILSHGLRWPPTLVNSNNLL